MSRHICFRCACRREDFAASSRFTTLFWDDALRVLESRGLDNPFGSLPDDAEVEGADFSRWWESAIARLAAAREELPTLYEVWRIHEDGVTWQSDAGYFRWRGEPRMVESVHDELVVRTLDEAQWEERLRWVPYPPPVLDEVFPEIVPAPRRNGGREPTYTLAAADFERLFRGTPLHLEHGPFLDFLRPEIEEARGVARHAAGSGEPVVLYTY
ncbi:MAG: hypothetical protein ABW277_23285 [Longimicrobiaceae bacterium]